MPFKSLAQKLARNVGAVVPGVAQSWPLYTKQGTEQPATRKFFYSKNVAKNNPQPDYKETPKETKEATSNLIGSLTDKGTHMPVLDIDFPCELVPSSTEGHYHLYINREMTWPQYQDLLEALSVSGVIEDGYYRAAIHQGGTFVRKPGIKKSEAEDEFIAEVNKWEQRLNV